MLKPEAATATVWHIAPWLSRTAALLPQVCALLHDMLHSQGAADSSQASKSSDTAGPGAKVLLFAYHRSVMQKLQCFLEGELEQRNVPKAPPTGYVRIDGEDPPRVRHMRQQQFHSDPTKRVRTRATAAHSCAAQVIYCACASLLAAVLDWLQVCQGLHVRRSD